MGVLSLTSLSFSQGWLYLFFLLLCGCLFDGVWISVGVTAAPLSSPSPSPSPSPGPSPSSSPSPLPVGQPDRRQFDPSPCAEVAARVEATLSAFPGAIPTVTAELGFACLQSVPNKPEPAQELIRSLQAYVQWQSTLAWLRDPPSTYSFPAADIPQGLTEIGEAAANGSFASEYEFQLSIMKVFASAHDGHFSFRGDIFKPFGFGNALAADIVAVSRDGKEPPRLYHGRMLTANMRMEDYPPAIVQINDQDAPTIIQDLNSQFSGFQDPDSQWNSMFPSYANPDAALLVAASFAFHGPSVTLTYDNGARRSEDSFTIVRPDVDFSRIASGEGFYDRFCNPDSVDVVGPVQGGEVMQMIIGSEESFDGETTFVPLDEGTAPGQEKTEELVPLEEQAPVEEQGDEEEPFLPISIYPRPVVSDSVSGATSGYFLDGEGYDDVAVLSISSFAPRGNVGGLEYLADFQSTVETFLEECRQRSARRLVVDLSANGGGFVVAGFELFAQLFPDEPRFQATNLRLPDSLAALARGVQNVRAPRQGRAVSDSDSELAARRQLASSTLVGNFIPGEVYRVPSSDGFAGGVEEILGPVELRDDSFTAYQQMPLNASSSAFNLTGVGARSDPPPAVFAAEDVVLLTDGTCGSTCTLFAYLATLGLGVKTVVLGGRPQPGPMQAIGGVEGAQVFFFNDMQADAAAVLALDPDAATRPGSDELRVLAEGYAIRRASNPSVAGAVNGKNAFMAADASTPLQFLWQPADCRVYYTWETLRDAEAAWRVAVDATWRDPEGICVEGSRVGANRAEGVDPAFEVAEEVVDGGNARGESGNQQTGQVPETDPAKPGSPGSDREGEGEDSDRTVSGAVARMGGGEPSIGLVLLGVLVGGVVAIF
ncbi:hypothetical protein SODALDRAFT_115835 [Sodiomyces alkalinus F11]|uniref:Uncharacterized protein n=1 Tax=Sodiomyces alkalinus (strain CBS 110278 / VKM F-3762 / F11) TaxID=1314773 RepID=A0A3N2Q3D7_SODAK|nr:hypothetical protein SODALDRAFT_115835 [Sodiomyces alkalinus F11]ROT41279.1 hypothetical protein SODALDRAFT_115835 [Sodiomyces alkalinus F11]